MKRYLQNLIRPNLIEWQRAQRNAKAVQIRILKTIIKENKKTVFGKDHHFSSLQTVEDFQEQVPIVNYDQLLPYITRIENGEQKILTNRKVVFMATTSGTTSTPKHIPVTSYRSEMTRKNLLLWLGFMMKRKPSFFNGKTLYIAGPYEEGYTKGGIMLGSISGYSAHKAPLFAKQKLAVNPKLYNIMNPDEKYFAMALQAVQAPITQIGFASAIEAIQFFEFVTKKRQHIIVELAKKHPFIAQRLAKLPDFKPRTLWPKLSTISCIKSDAQLPYIHALQDIIGGTTTVMDPGIYASEGRISLGLTDRDQESLLAAHENFFEFMPQLTTGNFGKPILIDALQARKKYKVIMTTREGLYRYDTGDVIEVTGFKNTLPIIKFVTRDRFINVCGELAPEEELVSAAQEALKNIAFKGFTFIPNTKNPKKKPFYEFLVEPSKKIDTKKLETQLDSILKRRIQDYKQMREEFNRLDHIKVIMLKKGSYDKFNKGRKGQPKPIHISMDMALKEKLIG